VAHDVLAGLSEPQADVVRDPAVPLAVVAGPGAGKTRALTRRIAWRCRSGDAAPGHTLALTFSRRAAGELRARLGALGLPGNPRDGGVVAGTFHAVAWAQLSRRRAEAGQRPLGLLTRPGQLARPVLADALGRPAGPGEVRLLLDEVAWARRQGAAPATYVEVAAAAGRWPPWPLEVVATAWGLYTVAKQRRLVVDLDDLLDTAAGMIEGDADAAAAVRWRYRHVYVDEYQDLNPVHLRLLRAWVGARGDVCLVGDPQQAVYGFNGACPALFSRLEVDWPGVKVVRLDEDFRSSPELVAVTQSVPGTSAARVSLRPPGPLPRLVGHADEAEEAAFIASAVWERRGGGTGWGRMSVLARTNARLRVIAAALTGAGVPWRLRDPRPLSERPAVEDWLEQLPRGTLLADVRLSTGDPDLAAVGAALDEYRAQVRHATVGGFRAWLDASGPADEDPARPSVDLVTFHRAKGLEWGAVWVAGVEEGTVPLASAAGTAAGVEEECRLLYVALTRASDELTVSWAGEPSRWVTPLAATAAQLSARPAKDEQLRRLAVLRGGLEPRPTGAGEDGEGAGAGAPSAAEAREVAATRRLALLSWRAVRARGALVPPEAVLPERALSRLASSGARTADDVVRALPGGGRRVHRWAPEIAAALAAGRTA
jgi:DNA helicase-2/ATP-dependent DNA helicase PcrA